MTLNEAITLIKSGHYASAEPVKWADLGCGTGLFTHALASLLPTNSRIYAVDTNAASLASITQPANATIEPIRQDFVKDNWPFDGLDGILMANSLHYVADKSAFLEKAKRHLTASGNFLLIEYDTDTANLWVPYPLSFDSLNQLAKVKGYASIEKINEMPSKYSRASIYCAYLKL